MTKTVRNDAVLEARAERLAEEAKQFRDRLIFLCDDLAPERGKYAYLEKRTGIGASKWQNLFLERQMPTIEMVIAILEYRRTFAKWLISGKPAVEEAVDGGGDAGGMAAAISEIVNADEAPDGKFWREWLAHREWIREKKKHGNREDE